MWQNYVKITLQNLELVYQRCKSIEINNKNFHKFIENFTLTQLLSHRTLDNPVCEKSSNVKLASSPDIPFCCPL